MIDFLLPATDRAADAQILAVIVVGTVAWFLGRRKPDARILIIGTTLVLLGAMGIRALH